MSDLKQAKPQKAQPVRGMQDFIGDQAARFEHVVEAFRDVGRRFGFRGVQVPVVEFTQVFARTLGETTDVVSKEMYTFEDRNGESLTLRPEFTAGICRAYISEGWQQFAPLKLVTAGPLFRYERPQKGRYRQFHQIDAEVIGAAEPAADVELIAFADLLLKELGITNTTLLVNTLGDSESRAAWREGLVQHFERYAGDLSEDSQRRLRDNPLRILDSKDPRDRPIVEAAPGISGFITKEAGKFFDDVVRGLRVADVKFSMAPGLVRGFDYYRHTAFEFVTNELGSQGTVIGGGRYDGLVESMGGPATPAVGWAGGVERLMMLTTPAVEEGCELAMVPLDDRATEIASRFAQILRAQGISVEMAFGGNEKRRFEKAKKAGVKRVLNVEVTDADGIELRLRNLAPSAEIDPVRSRLKAALAVQYSVEDDVETRTIRVRNRPA